MLLWAHLRLGNQLLSSAIDDAAADGTAEPSGLYIATAKICAAQKESKGHPETNKLYS